MREIKFRGWTGKEYDYDICLNEEGKVIDFDQGLYTGCFNEYVVEQYTGLKDKNGKEIYEGDILRCIDFSDDYFPDWTDVVEYDSRGYWTVDGGNVLGNMYNNDMMEIIGNIHENPEMLT